jgi:hypothetical protein
MRKTAVAALAALTIGLGALSAITYHASPAHQVKVEASKYHDTAGH